MLGKTEVIHHYVPTFWMDYLEIPAENVGFGIDKLKSWKQLTGYSVDIHPANTIIKEFINFCQKNCANKYKTLNLHPYL